jgi:hypothetical protein
LWQTGSNFCPFLVVASLYCDITKPVIPPQIEQLIAYCDTNCYPLVIDMDPNAYSSLWGSPATNPCGDMLKDFILEHGLLLHNVGMVNTFVSPVGFSITDLTLFKTRNLLTLENW